MIFWDASAVVPVLLDEPESAVMRELVGDDPWMIVWWGARSRPCDHGFYSLDERAAEAARQEGFADAPCGPSRTRSGGPLPEREGRETRGIHH